MAMLVWRAHLASLSGALLATLVLLGFAGRCAWAEEAVLVTSTAFGYAPGTVISSSDTLTLPDGASVTLLFRSGQMLRLRGPFEGSLEPVQQPAAKADVPVLVQLFRLRGVDASVIGGSRKWLPDTQPSGTAPMPVAGGPVSDRSVEINPRRTATYCLTASDRIRIDRPAGDAAAYNLRWRTNLEAIVWPAGADWIEWPNTLSIKDGDQFEIIAAGTPRATIRFRVLDQAFTSPAAWIAAGVLAGCHQQFDAELRKLGQATVPPELWLTSQRGRTPTYRSGEPIGLMVQSTTDGYLYCMALQADQSVVPIFPAGSVGGARLRGAVPVSLHSGKDGGKLRAGPPGTAQIACWLADSDLSSKLPYMLPGRAERRLPNQWTEDLDRIFASISGQPLAKAGLTIRVQ